MPNMTDEELKGLFDGLGDALRGEMRAQSGELRGEMRADRAELRRHFDEVAERFDSKYDLLAEGIMNLDEKMDRNHASIREEMRHGFAHTHDLIKFSHTLARRKR